MQYLLSDDKFRKPLPHDMQWRYTCVVLAQKFPGLPPEYFENLSYARRTSLLAILEAQHKAGKVISDRQKRKNEQRGKRGRRH